ncbi:hypothetical protein X474_19965 [Dethiosulfatarculus sandiegensis]|uniref:Uncharacterized protein n=1 Tax=Dethiosulfatarculus sandiegensis TaxID=1429043 RepID=A0A0D2J988_9BACT|nr:hypothetical protein X474_19965 [Dethiosulfatarculus sandiegensis]
MFCFVQFFLLAEGAGKAFFSKEKATLLKPALPGV